MKKIGLVLVLLAIAGFLGAQAPALLKIDYQCNVTAADPANYFWFTGPSRYMDSGATRFSGSDGKDTYDATAKASKYQTTRFFSHYQYDINGKVVINGGLRGLFLFAVADEATRVGDILAVVKNADGSILVRYVHRGTAYEILTDKAGNLDINTPSMRSRVIGTTDNKTIHADFATGGTLATLDWKKVWDANIADGKPIGTASNAPKTGKILPGTPDPAAMFTYKGPLAFSFDGKILKIKGDLEITKR